MFQIIMDCQIAIKNSLENKKQYKLNIKHKNLIVFLFILSNTNIIFYKMDIN